MKIGYYLHNIDIFNTPEEIEFLSNEMHSEKSPAPSLLKQISNFEEQFELSKNFTKNKKEITRTKTNETTSPMLLPLVTLYNLLST